MLRTKRKPDDSEMGCTYEWISQTDKARFRRELQNCPKDYIHQLDCKIGGEFYWNNILNEFKNPVIQPILYVVKMTTDDETRELLGFCLIRKGKLCRIGSNNVPVCEYYDDAWYIEYICTKQGQGYGRKFITHIHNTAIDSGIKNITLSALPYVIPFYYGLGYRLTFDTSCMESAEISSLAAELRAEIKRRISAGEKIPIDVEDLLKDDAFSKLILACLRQNLSTRKLDGADCDSNSSCAEDGLYMIICLGKREASVSSVFGPAFSNIPARFETAPKYRRFDDEDTERQLQQFKDEMMD